VTLVDGSTGSTPLSLSLLFSLALRVALFSFEELEALPFPSSVLCCKL
jgi:hypothetical protein